MAEVVLRERLEQAGLGGLVEVDSTGVSDEEHGNPIDPRARATLVAHGYPVPPTAPAGRPGTTSPSATSCWR